jgi:putative ABC transport system substrate-binding protein
MTLALARRIVAGIALLLAALLAGAQQPGRTYRIAYLAAAPRAANQALLDQFLQGMRDLGYVEGQNLILEYRFADGTLERLPALAREVAQLKPDVIFVSTTPGSLAAKAATATIPVVFVAVADPVGVGLVSNVGRPGGNVTGDTHIVG